MKLKRFILTIFLITTTIFAFANQKSNKEYAEILKSLNSNMESINIGSTFIVFDRSVFEQVNNMIELEKLKQDEIIIIKSKKTKLAVYYHPREGTFSDSLEVRNFDEASGSSGIFGEVIGITSTNSIYVREKSYYSKLRIIKKYIYDGNKYVNIEQPFYYIGEKSKTNTSINIYNDVSESILVGSLAPNTEVDVIGIFENPFNANYDGFWFLLSGKTGIIGWHKAGFIPQKQGELYSKLTGTIDIISGIYMP